MQRKPKIGDRIRECRNGYPEYKIEPALSNPYWVSEVKDDKIVAVQCFPYRRGAFDFPGLVQSFIFI